MRLRILPTSLVLACCVTSGCFDDAASTTDDGDGGGDGGTTEGSAMASGTMGSAATSVAGTASGSGGDTKASTDGESVSTGTTELGSTSSDGSGSDTGEPGSSGTDRGSSGSGSTSGDASTSSSSDDGAASSSSSDDGVASSSLSQGGGSSSSSGDESSSTDGGIMCGAEVCGDTEVCVGEACSCVAKLSGDTVLRTDGTVIHYDSASTGIVIEDSNLFFDMQGAVDLFEGMEHGCAARDDGTVWCWTDNLDGNESGQLGNGTFGGVTPAWQAHPVVMSEADGGGNLTDVIALNDNSARCYLASTTCAIRDDGLDTTAWCWGASGVGGSGAEGFFNDGDEGNHAYPTPIYESPGVVMTNVDAISLGNRHACAIRDGGDVWCWGTNVGGPLGQGDQVHRNYPALVGLPGPAQEIIAGSDVTCARVGDIAYCWGANNSGQVGIGDPASNTDGCINYCRLTPAPVRDGNDDLLIGVTDLHGGYLANCAIMADDTLWCWGAQINPYAAPLSVGGSDVVDVVMQSACGSGAITNAAVYLNTSADLRHGNTLITQACD